MPLRTGKGKNVQDDISTCERHKVKVKVSAKTTSLALYNIRWPRPLYDITGTYVASEMNALWKPTFEEAVYFHTLCASLGGFYTC